MIRGGRQCYKKEQKYSYTHLFREAGQRDHPVEEVVGVGAHCRARADQHRRDPQRQRTQARSTDQVAEGHRLRRRSFRAAALGRVPTEVSLLLRSCHEEDSTSASLYSRSVPVRNDVCRSPA